MRNQNPVSPTQSPLTAADVAARLNLSISRISQLARAAGMVKIGRDWIFQEADIPLLESRTRAGKRKTQAEARN